MLPKVDIIIPVYNDRACIRDAVASALDQRDVEVHCIVVNDGSTDDTATVLQGSEYFSRLEYHAKENGGVASARNVALANVQGDYCCFLDSDDLLEPDFCRRLIATMQETGARMAYCDHVLVEEFDPSIPLHGQVPQSGRTVDFADLLKGNCFMTPTVLFERQLAEGLFQDESLRYNEDWLFWLDCAAKAGIVAHCAEVLVRVRTRRGGLSARRDLHRDNYLRAVEAIEARFASKFPTQLKCARIVHSDNLRAFGLPGPALKRLFHALRPGRGAGSAVIFALDYLGKKLQKVIRGRRGQSPLDRREIGSSGLK